MSPIADRVIRAILTGDNAKLVRSMEESAAASEAAGKKIGDHMEAAAQRSGGAFQRLGNTLSNWGLPFGESVKKIGDHLGDAKTKGEKFGAAIGEIGKVSLVAGAAGLIAFGAESVKAAANFQESMTQLVTGAGESESNIKMVGSGILSMAGQVGVSAEQLAQGMYMIESAGYHGSAGLSVLRAAAEGAAVGNANMESVANAVTTALTDYHIPATRAAAVTSALVETVASGKMHMDDLALSLGRVMPVAAALGVTFQDVTGAMAAETNQGLSARFAAMHLQATLLALSAPSKTATKALTEIGLSAQQVKDELREHGLAGALTLIEQHVGETFPKNSVGYVTAMKAVLGGTVGYSTALMLSGKNMVAFEQNTRNIGTALDRGGEQVQGFNKVQGDLAFQMKQARAELDALAIRFGDILIPVLEHTAQKVAEVISWFERHKRVAEALGVTIAVVLGGAMAVYAEQKVAKAVRATQSFISDLSQLASKILGSATPAVEGLGNESVTTGGKISTAGGKAVTAGGEAATAGGEFATAGGEMATAGGEAATAGGEFATAGGEAVTAGGEATTAGAEMGAASKAMAGAMALFAGYQIGTALNNKFGISNTLAGGISSATGIGQLGSSYAQLSAVEAQMKNLEGTRSGDARLISELEGVLKGGSMGFVTSQSNTIYELINALMKQMQHLPHMAGGGTVRGPTLSWLGEGGETEYVVPQSAVSEVASALGGGGSVSPLPSGLSGGGGSSTLVLQIDGKTFARLIFPYLRDAGQRTGRGLVSVGLG